MKLRITNEQCQKVMLLLYFAFPLWFNLVIDRLPGSFYIGHAVLLLPFSCLLMTKQKQLSGYVDVFFLYALIAFLFVFKFLADSSMEPWFSDNVYSVRRFMLYPASGIFAYAIIRIANRKDILLQLARYIGLALFAYYAIESIEVITTGVFTYSFFGEERVSSYNIAWGYGMLSSIVFLLVDYVKNKKIWVLPFIAVGFVGILMFGSRVPCLIFLIFVLMLIFLYGNYDRKSGKYRKSVFAISLVLFFLIWIFYFGGLTWLADIFEVFGFESRTLLSILEGTFTNDNGRDRIWTAAIKLIEKRPFIGSGVFGERNAVFATGMKWGYSHNIFLEILVDFGCIVGGALIIYGLFVLIKSLIFPKDKDYQLLILAFLTISAELIVSNSFWFHTYFWGVLALEVNYHKETKRKMLSNKQRVKI